MGQVSMASSLETLVKILKLEQRKGYDNDAVIGGFARFAFHWEREAHSQARTDQHHALVDLIADKMRAYESLEGVDARRAAVEELIGLATGQLSPEPESEIAEPEAETKEEAGIELAEEPSKASPELKPEEIATPEPAHTSVRGRRGYSPRPASGEEPPDLNGPVTVIDGVGLRRTEQFERLGVHTVRDLLYLFPRRYDDYSRLKAINKLEPGEEVTVIGTIQHASARRTQSGKTLLEVVLSDGTGGLRLTWFNQPWLEKQLKAGLQVVVGGRVEQYLGKLTMSVPEWEPLERDLLHTGRIVPVYPLTQGLTSRAMRQLMKKAVSAWLPRLPDYLPLDVRESADLMDLDDALEQAHFPDSWDDLEAARARLAFDELLLLQLGVMQSRVEWQARPGTPAVVDDAWLERALETLPYELTGAQRRALDAIRADMARTTPMNRLLQGDVGSGKTVVAAIAMAIAIANHTQAALMAPTSILAGQHYTIVGEILRGVLGDEVQVALLTGALSPIEREAIYQGLADGTLQAVVGTHALIQEGVTFADLSLAVIDEQHRFGVQQRGTLRGKATNPHLLVMSATPIPRTLALTVHADLDLTIIDEMPPGRRPVQTRVLHPSERERGYQFVRTQIEKGRQAFIIYPLVEESDKVEALAAVEEYQRLQESIFPDLRLGLLHGRMRPEEKEAVMEAFYRGEMDILVSTSVIEVGIDVPNASVVVVEGANRFGLAQLHQFRGRVGRGEHESYCLLLSDQPASPTDGDQRLRAMEETDDGFRLAEIDWEMRGAGDLLGIRQSGLGIFHFADLMNPRLVEKAQGEARRLLERDPGLQQPEHRPLAERVETYRMAGDVS
jgi:ATP-dependent DNA helicase RecG